VPRGSRAFGAHPLRRPPLRNHSGCRPPDNGAVPQGNLQRARQGYEVFNRGEVDRFLTEFVHPEYEFHTGVRVPSIPTVVRGRDGLRAWIQQWYQEPWEEQLQMDVERMEELDDGRVLALLTLRASGRGSGARVETEYAHILTLRGGLCVRVDGFPSWNQALSAAGLGE
jgi:ketosteroid isomerase-like protein